MAAYSIQSLFCVCVSCTVQNVYNCENPENIFAQLLKNFVPTFWKPKVCDRFSKNCLCVILTLGQMIPIQPSISLSGKVNCDIHLPAIYGSFNVFPPFSFSN